MYKNFDPTKPYFASVALATILLGATILSVGLVELLCNILADTHFFAPSLKIMGGLVVTSLGYLHLELELLRTKK